MVKNSVALNTFEKQAQRVILTVITGLLLWAGITVLDNKTAMARLEAKVSALHDQVDRIDNRLYRHNRTRTPGGAPP